MTARLFRRAGGTTLALGLSALVLPVLGCGKPPQPLPPPDAPTVGVRHPAVRDYAPTKEFTGRLATKDPVKVIPQVSGMLLRRAFTEGETVQKGKTVLFEIDKTLFEADLNKSKADVAKAEADIKNWTAQVKLAQAEFARVNEAYKKGAMAKTELDKAVANEDVAKAQIDLSKATKEAAVAAEARAAENLRYCTIYAPVTGRSRRSLVAEKSVVDAYKTELVEISPIDPIYALFEVDELTSLWYRNQIYDRKEIPDPRNENTPLRCWITLKDGQTYPPAGQPGQPVKFIDPEIERGTGTRTIRATFPNADGRLSSGDSVRIRVDAGRPRQVLTISETAVFPQNQRRYVYVAASSPDGDTAELREVEPGPSFDGVVVVDKGLTTADRVVVDNLLRVRPGAKIQVKKEG